MKQDEDEHAVELQPMIIKHSATVYITDVNHLDTKGPLSTVDGHP